LEWNNLLTDDQEGKGVNYFLPIEKMQAKLGMAGVKFGKNIVVHCQSGVRASFMVFCLQLLGYPSVKLYDDPMAEWANETDTPLEVLI